MRWNTVRASMRANFQELVGEWLALENSAQTDLTLQGITLKTLNTYGAAIGDVLHRAEAIDYGSNPWVAAAGLPLGDFLAQSMDKIRAASQGLRRRREIGG